MSTVLEAPPPLELPTTVVTHTADDLLHMPDGERYELVDGELVERVCGALSGWIAGHVAAELGRFAHQHGGWAFGWGVGYCCFVDDPERVRRPDASFVRADRLPIPPQGFITIAPDLAVEVVSPNDMYYEVELKVDEYLAAGVRMVWVINPANQSVRVFHPKRIVEEIGTDGELTGGDVMPGFTCGVRLLFPPLTQPVG